ncbi:MAG TPA: DUF3467 domain-containing protein [Jiangellaceae bacterium]|jgi:hypothetical protein|nr:DUF3467 domain-containing protein [Jiangellaceae bacterium]
MSQPQMRVSMPDEQVPGVFADFVSVWHTNDVFTFDFAALARPPTLVEGDDGTKVTTAQAQIVARVRVPPSQVFEIMKALERQLTAWEQATGRRQKQVPPES